MVIKKLILCFFSSIDFRIKQNKTANKGISKILILEKALKFFNKSEDLIFCKGRRFGRPILDVLFTISMSFFETILLGKLMWDINAQPTIFSRHFFEKWQNPPNDFSIDLYAYYMAKKFNLKVCRFPVKFGERAYGISHWNIDWKSKWNFIKRTISYSINLRRNV